VPLENLERLVGRWSIRGEAEGETCWRWAEGKRFLFQDFDIIQGGRHHKGLEVIGHVQRLGESPSPEIWSRAYHFGSGLTLDYVYENGGRHADHLVPSQRFRQPYAGPFQPGRGALRGRMGMAGWWLPGPGNTPCLARNARQPCEIAN